MFSLLPKLMKNLSVSPLMIRFLSFIVGIVYLASAIGKAIDINTFADTITDYGVPSLRLFAPIIVGIEIFLGFALIFWLRPNITAKFSFFFLIFLTLLFFYGFVFKGINDCGCFGTVLKISPLVSFLRNIFMIGISWIIWQLPHNNFVNNTILKMGAIYSFGFIAFAVTGYEMKQTYRPIENIRDKAIKETVLGHSITLPKVNKYLIFIYSPSCSHCQEATPIVKQYLSTGTVEATIGVTASEFNKKELQAYYYQFKPNFETIKIPKDSIRKITRSLPMTLIIENGMVKEIMRVEVDETKLIPAKISRR